MPAIKSKTDGVEPMQCLILPCKYEVHCQFILKMLCVNVGMDDDVMFAALVIFRNGEAVFLLRGKERKKKQQIWDYLP